MIIDERIQIKMSVNLFGNRKSKTNISFGLICMKWSNMKKIKYLVAIIIFIILVLIGNWPGTAAKDEWDNLMKWVKGKK